jgi:hypothetical protein
MKFVDHLSRADKKKLNQVTKKKPEKLSPRDLRDLMGENRDTFKRVNGAIKRR